MTGEGAGVPVDVLVAVRLPVVMVARHTLCSPK